MGDRGTAARSATALLLTAMFFLPLRLAASPVAVEIADYAQCAQTEAGRHGLPLHPIAACGGCAAGLTEGKNELGALGRWSSCSARE
jgi:hypothetical protein